ncbi:MAG: hypothetical protein R3B93_10505 [Bacteroidia bacterium]
MNYIKNSLLVRDKAEYRMYNHDQHKLGGRLINDWFADLISWKELVNAVVMSTAMPKTAVFFQLLEFSRVMFRIFLGMKRCGKIWTSSLNQALPIRVPTTPLQDMVEMVKVLNQQQMGNKQHQNITIKNKRGVEKSVADWFKGNVDEFLEALANEENGWVVPGNPENSLLLNELMSTDNRMGQAASGVIPNTGGKTGRQVTINWINSLKIAPPKRRKNMKIYLSSIHQHEGGSKPVIRGQGTIH